MITKRRLFLLVLAALLPLCTSSLGAQQESAEDAVARFINGDPDAEVDVPFREFRECPVSGDDAVQIRDALVSASLGDEHVEVLAQAWAWRLADCEDATVRAWYHRSLEDAARAANPRTWPVLLMMLRKSLNAESRLLFERLATDTSIDDRYRSSLATSALLGLPTEEQISAVVRMQSTGNVPWGFANGRVRGLFGVAREELLSAISAQLLADPAGSADKNLFESLSVALRGLARTHGLDPPAAEFVETVSRLVGERRLAPEVTDVLAGIVRIGEGGG